MFTGFPSENTPSIQVWDFSQAIASTGSRSVSLTDDCAPIQYFRTGANTAPINVWLPSAPPEGKIIKIINHKYAASNQQVAVYYPDTNSTSAVQYFALGVGQTVDFCFSKIAYGFGANFGYQSTGWMMLTQAGSSSVGYYGVSLSDGSHASNAQSMALGGTGNVASGVASLAAGGSSNTASAQSSATIGGSINTANGSNSAVIGGTTNAASGSSSAVIGGTTNTASGTYSLVVGSYGTARSLQNIQVAAAVPITATAGTSQTSCILLGGVTAFGGTNVILTTNGGAGSTTNRLVLPNNSAYYYSGSVIAATSGAADTRAWTFEGLIKRGATASTTKIVQQTINTVAGTAAALDSSIYEWLLTVTANTSTGCLDVTANQNSYAAAVRWVCKIDTTEVTY